MCWVPRRLLRKNDQSLCPQLERPLDDLSQTEQHVIAIARLLDFIGNQHVFSIKVEKRDLLNYVIVNVILVSTLLPRGDDIALVCLDLHQPSRRDFREFEGPYRRVALCREDAAAFPDRRRSLIQNHRIDPTVIWLAISRSRRGTASIYKSSSSSRSDMPSPPVERERSRNLCQRTMCFEPSAYCSPLSKRRRPLRS